MPDLCYNRRLIFNNQYSKGFTLIELLVVVAIIAVLVSILLPALSAARDAAKGAICQSNLRSLGLGIQQYAIDNNGIAPAAYDAHIWPKWWQNYLSNSGYLPNLPTFKSGSSAEKVWVCPICEVDALGRGADYVATTYLRVRNYAWWVSLGTADWIRLSSIENPSWQMFVTDGTVGDTEFLHQGGKIVGMAGAKSGSTTAWQHLLSYMSGYRNFSGCMGFFHSNQANVIFADWHVEQLSPDQLTYNMYENPDS